MDAVLLQPHYGHSPHVLLSYRWYRRQRFLLKRPCHSLIPRKLLFKLAGNCLIPRSHLRLEVILKMSSLTGSLIAFFLLIPSNPAAITAENARYRITRGIRSSELNSLHIGKFLTLEMSRNSYYCRSVTRAPCNIYRELRSQVQAFYKN